MTKRFFFSIALCLSCFFALGDNSTDIMYLSGKGSDDAVEWDFFCTAGRQSGKWGKIRVPSCWELEGYGSFTYGNYNTETDESGLYKTTFNVPSDWRGKRVFIVFDGSMTDTYIKVNGKSAGPVHQGAFYRFKREITPYIKFGKSNLLEVRVDKTSSDESINKAERFADFWVFGGIFRPVFLEAVPTDFIEYTAVDAKCDGQLRVDVIADKKIAGAGAEVKIFDAEGKCIGSLSSPTNKEARDTVRATGRIEGIKPWSAEDPQLYTAVISLMKNGKPIHTVTDRIGFRTVEVKPHDGIYVNGAKMRFKGVNRHSHWPTTGRTTSKALSISDVKLMKEMNMNAVRMSHYPPDKHFLEVCDSLGMYVIDELCAWQYPPYETKVGKILVAEMLKRDLNRPSIVLWANGNEGGTNFDFDPIFKQFDPQKRAVLHPWALSDNINTVHYINYNSGIGNMLHGRDIFMPTEILHGLYDGGHGAGLDDYWNMMLAHPLSAGMFLWDFADQAAVRDDMGGFHDTEKDRGADGIVGPYREKEGSFFTIKQIWSPIHLYPKYINPWWDGVLEIENRYSFTNSDECTFSYRMDRIAALDSDKIESISGGIKAPSLKSGERGCLKIDLPANWQSYDFLYVTAKDKTGAELFTWSYELGTPQRIAARLLPEKSGATVSVKEDNDFWKLKAGNVEVAIEKGTGLLGGVTGKTGNIPLRNGPTLITTDEMKCDSVICITTGEVPQIKAYYHQGKSRRLFEFTWSLSGEETLDLEYVYTPQDMVKMAGITFDYPEEGVKGVTMLGNGPYRVYNNRLKGGTIGIWDKTYNNTVTGESWDYPEFKGYYSLFYGMRLDSPAPFEVYNDKQDVFLHLFTPEVQKQYNPSRNNTIVDYPSGNISFLDAIPAVGTKFGKAENYGPQSQPHRAKGNDRENCIHGNLHFRF